MLFLSVSFLYILQFVCFFGVCISANCKTNTFRLWPVSMDVFLSMYKGLPLVFTPDDDVCVCVSVIDLLPAIRVCVCV